MRHSLLTAAQAAERLGVSPRRVRQYCQRKQLPAAQVGRDWLIAEKDLAGFRPLPPGRPRKLKGG